MANNLSPISSASGGSSAPVSPSGSATDPTAKLANEQTFLQLLVAQMKNQDPLNPTDSVQFVSQLAQFSQLEQVLAVRHDTDAIVQQMTQTANQSTGQQSQTQS